MQGNWPNKFRSAPDWLKPFYPFRDELYVDNHIVMRGTKVIVPESLRSQYMKQIHKNHMSADSTTKLARDYFYWPKISEDIHNFVDKCDPCNATKPQNQKEPMILLPIPDHPWQILSTDVLEWNNQVYQVLVDSYSGWFEIDPLKDTTSDTIISVLKPHFATHGVPEKLYSDNTTYYMSAKFQQFCANWNIDHVTSSPRYAQSNGLAERAVQSAKTLLERSKRDNSHMYLCLLLIRNTPRDNNLKSPAKRLLSRKTKIPLPTTDASLKPQILPNVPSALEKVRLQKKNYYDESARPLAQLQPGDTVRIREDKFTKSGVITSEADTSRSYMVQTGSGTYRRNRKHLRPSHLPVAQPVMQNVR